MEVCFTPCRVKNFHQRSTQFEQILKKNEQMFALLALTAGLCPAATRVLDESVLNLLQDKCALGYKVCEELCMGAAAVVWRAHQPAAGWKQCGPVLRIIGCGLHRLPLRRALVSFVLSRTSAGVCS